MRSEEEFSRNLRLNITIPWDTNTFVGWVCSVVLCSVLMLLILPQLSDPKTIIDRTRDRDSILIVLGTINGLPEPEGGNLQDAGTQGRGEEAQDNLSDNTPNATARRRGESSPDPDHVTRPVASSSESGATEVDSIHRSGQRLGSSDPASENGTGLNPLRPDIYGSGGGQGIGEVTWSGGGNRTALSKPPPKYPRGVNTSAEIKVQFKVDKNGVVVDAFIKQKGHPLLERAALDAIYKWRFNPDPENREMIGVIPFSFKVR